MEQQHALLQLHKRNYLKPQHLMASCLEVAMPEMDWKQLQNLDMLHHGMLQLYRTHHLKTHVPKAYWDQAAILVLE
jgi:hypothetical protein